MTETAKIKFYLKLAGFIFLILFATIQYILILRHKSTNVSDSYFYKHIYYQIQGYSFHEAYEKNLRAIDFQQSDAITKNIFQNPTNYRRSFNFFSSRIFYPYSAAIVNLIVKNEYIAFLLPIFISYIGTIWLTFYFSTRGLNYFFGLLATAFLIAFYPFLDWSTYFLTDTIATFLWMLLIFLAYQYIVTRKNIFLLSFALTLILSFLNREQTILTLPLFLLVYLSMKIFKYPKTTRNVSLRLLFVVTLLVFPYLLLSLLRGSSFLENLEYMRNNFGLYSNEFTIVDDFFYLLASLKTSHIVLVLDLARHHWWFTFTVLGLVSIAKTIFFTKEKKLIDLLLFSSAVASYLFIVWPFLSYRFLFPAIISIIYFSSKFMRDYFNLLENS